MTSMFPQAWYPSSVMRAAAQPKQSLAFNGVKIFSATLIRERDQLGEVVTAWLMAHPELTVIDIVVTQSSDAAYHCLAVSVFYSDPLVAA